MSPFFVGSIVGILPHRSGIGFLPVWESFIWADAWSPPSLAELNRGQCDHTGQKTSEDKKQTVSGELLEEQFPESRASEPVWEHETKAGN